MSPTVLSEKYVQLLFHQLLELDRARKQELAQATQASAGSATMAFSVLKHTLVSSMPAHVGSLNNLPNLFPGGGLLDFWESPAADLLQGLDSVSREFHLRLQFMAATSQSGTEEDRLAQFNELFRYYFNYASAEAETFRGIPESVDELCAALRRVVSMEDLQALVVHNCDTDVWSRNAPVDYRFSFERGSPRFQLKTRAGHCVNEVSMTSDFRRFGELYGNIETAFLNAMREQLKLDYHAYQEVSTQLQTTLHAFIQTVASQLSDAAVVNPEDYRYSGRELSPGVHLRRYTDWDRLGKVTVMLPHTRSVAIEVSLFGSEASVEFKGLGASCCWLFDEAGFKEARDEKSSEVKDLAFKFAVLKYAPKINTLLTSSMVL